MQVRHLKQIATAQGLAVVLFFLLFYFDRKILETAFARPGIGFPPYLLLQAEKNVYFAFSLPLSFFIGLTIMAAVLVFLTGYVVKNLGNISTREIIAYSAILSGAVLNFWQRLHTGFVWDYFVIQIFGFRGVWNLADFVIIVGMLIWGLNFKNKSTTLPPLGRKIVKKD